jgi:hypothetical protein
MLDVLACIASKRSVGTVAPLVLKMRFTFLWSLPIIASAEYALVNIMRHAERYPDYFDPHLALDGLNRSQYIARCVASELPSLAFPLGPPQRMLASRRPTSVRPWETLAPLSEKLRVPIDNDVDMQDVKGFVSYLQRVQSGETLLVAWQHWFIHLLAHAIDPRELTPRLYPNTCNYSQWAEPVYTNNSCFDVIWQLTLYREDADHPWRARSFTAMHMGYGGSGESPCSAAFSPHSNPTSWKLISEPSDSHNIILTRQSLLLAVASIAFALAAVSAFSWKLSRQCQGRIQDGKFQERLLIV